MARPRAFDETDVVATAQDRFWSYGYAATSLDDLVKATGLSKGSIYNTFCDKHTLYLRTFERYCDDIIVHAASERQARFLWAAIARRLADCGVELNERKTRIVYCQDANRRGCYEQVSFTFLGYKFRPRLARSKTGGKFVSFLPAIGDDEKKRISGEIRRWRLHRWSDVTLEDLAKAINAPNTRQPSTHTLELRQPQPPTQISGRPP